MSNINVTIVSSLVGKAISGLRLITALAVLGTIVGLFTGNVVVAPVVHQETVAVTDNDGKALFHFLGDKKVYYKLVFVK